MPLQTTTCLYTGVSTKTVVPPNGWFIMENNMNMDDDWGYPYFSNSGNPHLAPMLYKTSDTGNFRCSTTDPHIISSWWSPVKSDYILDIYIYVCIIISQYIPFLPVVTPMIFGVIDGNCIYPFYSITHHSVGSISYENSIKS